MKNITPFPTTLESGTGEGVSDVLNVLFAGRDYPEEVRMRFRHEIDAAVKTETYCPICKGLDNCKMLAQGWQVLFDEEAADTYKMPQFRYRMCKFKKEQELQEKEKVILSPRFQQRTFETFRVTPDNEKAFQAARFYADELSLNTTKGLMFIGNPGTGKTHLAVAILKKALSKGISCAFVLVPKLLEEIRRSYSSNDESRSENITRTVTKRLVVLDDIGAERTTDWVQEQLYLIINDRYENMQPTIVTSNCNIQELEKRIGLKTVDRLSEMCQVVPLVGKSWRRRNG
mgnify:CR=1 FL=1